MLTGYLTPMKNDRINMELFRSRSFLLMVISDGS